MIKLIVGLGNPGRQYESTRHNVGFWFVDSLAREQNSSWVKKSEFQGFVSEVLLSNQKIVLLKPDTFMNLSGQSVGKLMRYYKLTAEQVLIVHDELDFEAGIVKLKQDGGHAGHNGLRDIIAHLNVRNFYRLRIGIGRPITKQTVADFVLSSPSRNELSLLMNAFAMSRPYIDDLVSGSISDAMIKINSLN